MKQSVYILIFAFLIGTANAADYRDIDPGDYFYINNGGENDRVRVVRKLGNEKVKVKDTNTGEGMVVQASKLLTKSQLDTEFYAKDQIADNQIADKERQIAEIEVQIKILEVKADTLPEDEAESIYAQLDNLIKIQIKLLDEISAITNSEIARHNQLQLASREKQKLQQETLRKQDEIINLIATVRSHVEKVKEGVQNSESK